MYDKKMSEIGSVKVHESVHTDDNSFNFTMYDKKMSEFGSDKPFSCSIMERDS